MKLPASLLAAALALAAVLQPASAGAATHHRASHAAGPSFPMKADEYRALMEKRIDSVRAVIDRKLDRRGVSPDRKKQIHAIFDESAKDLRAEIARAAADGTVTQREAEKVKPLLTGLRSKVRERLRAGKDPHAKGKPEKEEAKKEKAKAGAKEAPSKDGARKPPAPDASADGEHTHHAKAVETHPTTGQTKATKATTSKKKGAGATKPAKATGKKAGKKPKAAETGEDL
jgi:hypothetical protein